MSDLVNVELNVFGTNFSISTDNPDEMKQLAHELENELILLSNQYPGVKHSIIYTMTCLKMLGLNKKLMKENTDLVEEYESINKAMKSIYV
jgi:cell division protein ZapA (FtsZ GTPase activity inhibitor)